MLRQTITDALDHDPSFRWRGINVTRIENLSDIVFALALTILITSASPVRNFADLQAFLVSIVPASAAFAVLLSIWHHHFTFFRRYGLADGRIIFLNAILLFLVLYTAYPLRFGFDSLFGYFLLVAGDNSRVEALGTGYREAGIIYSYFSSGYALIQILMMAMYRHAGAKADILQLTTAEKIITRRATIKAAGIAIIALTTSILAATTALVGFAGGLMILTLPLVIGVNRALSLPPVQQDPRPDTDAI